MRIGSLFTGYGGLDTAVEDTFNAETAWHCDNDPAATAILTHNHPNTPNLGDITTVQWNQIEPVDILTGGFPCQDLSAAGRRVGLQPNTRSGLWEHMARAINVLRPRYVIAENVRGLLHAEAHSDLEPCPWCLGDGRSKPLRALGAVLGDLAELGYDARWCGLPASDVGAPHNRERVFILAAAAHTHGAAGYQWRQPAPRQAQAGRAWSDAGRRGGAPAADAASDGRDEGRAEPAGQLGGPDAALGGGRDWGDYEPAITRWEHITGRPAPPPTQPGQRSAAQLSPRFVEWMMGLPTGLVTDVAGLSRNDQLRVLGNGVVPQQARAALATLTNTTGKETQ